MKRETAKTIMLSCRISAGEKQSLLSAAKIQGKTVSELLREFMQSLECNGKNNGNNE